MPAPELPSTPVTIDLSCLAPAANSATYGSLEEAVRKIPLSNPTWVVPRMTLMMSIKKHGFEELLAQQGFRSFAPLAMSSNTLILEVAGGQLLCVRLKNGSCTTRAQSLRMSQGLPVFELGGIQVELLDAKTLNVSKQEGEAFIRDAAKDDFEVVESECDASKGDLGKHPDGTVIALDPGGLRELDGVFPIFDEVRDKDYVVRSSQKSIYPQLKGTGYISKNEYFFPALMDGRARGVLSDADRDALGTPEGLVRLMNEKPECFMMLTKTDITQEEQNILRMDGGLAYLCHKYPKDTFRVTLENLPEFSQAVFDEGLYPKQAMERMHAREISTVVGEIQSKGRIVELRKPELGTGA